MELKVEHLAPYLPYSVKYIHRYSTKKEVFSSLDNTNIIEFTKAGCNHSILLKPLKDLSEKVENEFLKYSEARWAFYDQKIIDLFCYESIKTEAKLTDIDLTTLPYKCVEYLFRNHYDFFGLIEKGLAIDINTIN